MRAPEAGNTVTSLTPIPATALATAPSASDLDAYVAEQRVADATAGISGTASAPVEPTADEVAEFEAKFEEAAAEFHTEPAEEYVTRAEFDELLARIAHFNKRSSQHI